MNEPDHNATIDPDAPHEATRQGDRAAAEVARLQRVKAEQGASARKIFETMNFPPAKAQGRK